MLPIRELTMPIHCDICDRLTYKYIFIEEEGILMCNDCYEERYINE